MALDQSRERLKSDQLHLFFATLCFLFGIVCSSVKKNKFDFCRDTDVTTWHRYALAVVQINLRGEIKFHSC